MNDLIERQAAIETVRKAKSIGQAHRMLIQLPTVDAVLVVHGRWIRKDYWSQGVGMGESYGYYYNCSKCGNLVRGGYNECGKKYCDECGARMDGEDGEPI